MLGTFLPWAKIPLLGNIAGTAGDGWLTLTVFALSLVCCFAGGARQPFVGGARGAGVSFSVMAAVLGVWRIHGILGIKAEVEALGGAFAERLAAGVQVGAGLYVVVIAGIAFAVVAFVNLRR